MIWHLALLMLMIATGAALAMAGTSLMDRAMFRRLIALPLIAGLSLPLGAGVGACVSFVALQTGVLPGLSAMVFEAVVMLAVIACCSPLVVAAVRRCDLTPYALIAARLRHLTTMRPGTHALLMIAFISQVIAILTVWTAYMRAPSGQYDAWAIWNLRAHFMFVAGDDWRLAFDPAMGWSHTDYPLLLPLTVWRGWRMAGMEDIYWPAIVAVGFGVSAAMLLFSIVTLLCGAARGALVTAYLLTLPFFADMATWQYADVPLACYMLGSLGVTALAWSQRRPGVSMYILAGALAGLAAFTKNEGLVFAGALTLSVVAGLAIRRQWRRAVGWLAGVLPVLACVAMQKLTLSAANDLVGGAGRASLWSLLTDPQRHAIILDRAGDMVPDAAQPLLLLALMVAMLLAPGRSGLRRPSVLLVIGAPLLALLLAYDAAYLVSPNDLAWHINTSLDRLILQWLPLALLWLALLTRWLGAKGYGLGGRRGGDPLRMG